MWHSFFNSINPFLIVHSPDKYVAQRMCDEVIDDV